jgi:hypothetical protein
MKINRIIALTAVCIVVGYVAFKMLEATIGVTLLKKNGKCINGVLLSEYYLDHEGRRVSMLYEITVDGRQYKGNSLELEGHEVGDSVCVAYLKSFPSMNRPVKFFDPGEAPCNCK